MNEFAKRLREIRLEKSMTQGELAKRVGISPSAIGMYEQGRRDPSAEIIEKLAKALDVSPAYLQGWSVKLPKENFHAYPWNIKYENDILAIIKTSLGLKEESRERLLHYAKFLLSEENQNRKD